MKNGIKNRVKNLIFYQKYFKDRKIQYQNIKWKDFQDFLSIKFIEEEQVL